MKKNSVRRFRALIIDDHPMMRRGLVHFLRDEANLEICGQAADAKEGLAAATRLRPDLVIVDISMPGKNGLELVKEIRAHLPSVKILVHSMHDQQIYAERVLRAGARGYVMKDDDGTELLQAVREVLAGGVYRPPDLLQSPVSPRHSNDPNGTGLLTDRELEILSLIGHGHSNASISQLLNLSIKTVDAHRERTKRKLRFKSSTELNLFAVRWVDADQLTGVNKDREKPRRAQCAREA